MILLYLIEWIIGLAFSLFAILFCWLIAIFVDYKTGHLPWQLSWFETVDTDHGVFDTQWMQEHPHWSPYIIALTWIARNPAYGYCAWCNPNIKSDTQVKVRGDITIQDGENGKAGWYLITTPQGYFDASFIWHIPGTNRCIRGDYGWQYKTRAQGIIHKTEGSLQVEFLFRLSSFGITNK